MLKNIRKSIMTDLVKYYLAQQRNHSRRLHCKTAERNRC